MTDETPKGRRLGAGCLLHHCQNCHPRAHPLNDRLFRTGPPDPRRRFGIYVHWPFCASKCPYCDFNSHVRHAPVDEGRFLAAFRTEIAMSRRAFRAARFPASSSAAARRPSCSRQPWRGFSRPLTMPGGRPPISRSRWRPIPRASRPVAFAAIGPRGEPCLARCPSHGRHLPESAGAPPYGRGGNVGGADGGCPLRTLLLRSHLCAAEQSASAWRAELKEAIARAAEHLSLYQLTIEPGTPFLACMRPASLSHRTTTWRGHSMM